jgi:hypothetical protein
MAAGLLRLETSKAGHRTLRVAQDAAIVFALSGSSPAVASVCLLLEVLDSHLVAHASAHAAQASAHAAAAAGAGAGAGEGAASIWNLGQIGTPSSLPTSSLGADSSAAAARSASDERLVELGSSVRELLARAGAARPVLEEWIDDHMNGYGPAEVESWREVTVKRSALSCSRR